jgi:hypothetical protein
MVTNPHFSQNVCAWVPRTADRGEPRPRGGAGLHAGGLHYHEGAQKPQRLTFFSGQRVRLSAHIHGVLSFDWAMPIREL